ncbi:hypothetical protein MMC32_005775 [Xylographa parallela]|nr:hypothetical protein [Xylographa parallela]
MLGYLTNSIFIIALCLVFSVVVVQSQSTCSPKLIAPLVLPVRNVTLASQEVYRGIPLSVGTPLQNLAFLLDSLASNDTLLNDVGDFCDNTTSLIQCQYNAGGQIDTGASSTWSQASSAAAAGAAPYDSDLDSADIFGTDTLQINTSIALKHYPLGILRGSNAQPNAIGFNVNSTFLNALQAAKLIPSRTWSLFWGLTGAEPSSQMDGSLVIGGYDAAKTAGPNSTQPTTEGQGCSLLVTMTAINLNFPNGTNFNILGTSHGAALRMCVSPIYPIMTLPYDIWQSFQAFGGGTYIGRSVGINVWGEVFAAEGV